MLSLPPSLRSLRHRNYRLFLSGQLVSLVGTWMQIVAQSWLVYRLTESETLLGLINFAGQLPMFVLAPVAGVLADRVNRHRVIMVAQGSMMILAFVLAALTLTNRITLPFLFALAALAGIATAFDTPARQAFISDMVSREDLPNAIGLNSTMYNGARVIGPAIAGLVVAAVGEGWCFLLNGISYVAVLAALGMMDVPEWPSVPEQSALSHIREGLSFAGSNPPVRALLLMTAAMSLFGWSYTVLMPVMADRVLGGGAGSYGVLMAASGVGALGGAIALTLRREVRGLGRLVAISGLAFGGALIAFAASRSLWLSLVLLAVVGFAMMVEMAARNTALQMMVPDRLRGRIMSLYAMMFLGVAPFGALLAGTAAGALGAPATIALGGAVCVAVSLFFGLRLPRLRAAAQELVAAQQSAPPGPPDQAVPARG